MRITRVIQLLALTAICSVDAADEFSFTPTKHEVNRYRHIWEKSPFVTETPVIADKGGGLAQRFVLTGVASLQEKPIIFVLDRQSLERMAITEEPNAKGISLISVEPNHDPKQSQATIRLGTEQGVIRYDLAALQSVNKAPDNAPTVPTPVATVPAETAIVPPQPVQNAPRPVRTIRRPKPINLTN